MLLSGWNMWIDMYLALSQGLLSICVDENRKPCIPWHHKALKIGAKWVSDLNGWDSRNITRKKRRKRISNATITCCASYCRIGSHIKHTIAYVMTWWWPVKVVCWTYWRMMRARFYNVMINTTMKDANCSCWILGHLAVQQYILQYMRHIYHCVRLF